MYGLRCAHGQCRGAVDGGLAVTAPLAADPSMRWNAEQPVQWHGRCWELTLGGSSLYADSAGPPASVSSLMCICARPAALIAWVLLTKPSPPPLLVGAALTAVV